MLSRTNAKPLCGVFTENTYNFISFISPVTRYYQQLCTPLASCEQKNKRRMVCRLCFLKKNSTQGYSGCFWSATSALNAAAKGRGRGGGAEGGSEEEGFDWVKRSTYAIVLRNGGSLMGLWVSAIHWGSVKNPDVHTVKRELCSVTVH